MQKDLCQITKTISLLRQCVYPKPPLQPPALIAWGCQHEPIVIKKCVSHKNAFWSTESVDKCGFIVCAFIVCARKGWLGVSPNG